MPMKIGVIADTHLDAPTPRLERVVEGVFGDADCVVHAGDIRNEAVLRAFGGIELIAVWGNNDPQALRQQLPEKVVFEARGFRIGVTHGWSWPFRLHRRVRSRFDDVDCIVYGHSHRAFCQRIEGVLMFNPGAFCGGLCSLGRRSVGLLTIDKEIRAEVIAI
ncbi:MAG: metallophosphoesterase family protein [Desulfobacteraceae bacterium]|jgi:putative phosphoesterase